MLDHLGWSLTLCFQIANSFPLQLLDLMARSFLLMPSQQGHLQAKVRCATIRMPPLSTVTCALSISPPHSTQHHQMLYRLHDQYKPVT
jgi:hypothetical protein